MTNIFTQYLCAALVGVAVISSCSRPVAYFQPGTNAPFATLTSQPAITAASDQAVVTRIEPLEQARETMTQLDAYVRNDSKLATSKTLNQRMNRVKNMLASTPRMLKTTASSSYDPGKMSGMERLVLRKINKQIGHQLAPKNPEKTMVNRGQLIGGIILLIGGLVLLVAGTGTAAFIGLIIALVGALGLILGLFGE